MSQALSTDVLIVGGGIAGLWLNARLRRAGFATLLVEKGSLGGGQSVKSQGIIHGGTKYALHGALTGSSEAIAAMPGRWREALAGAGELDLSGVRLLSDRKSTRLNSSHVKNSYAVFCLKKKNIKSNM